MGRPALLVLLPAVIVLSACGGGSKSNGEAKKTPEQVVADARKAAVAAGAVHVSGSIVDAGGPLTLDLTLVKGAGGRGTMSERGLTFQLVRLGDKAYIKGSEGFLKQFAGSTIARLLHGKWLEGSASSGRLAALAPLTDIEKLFTASLGSHGKLKNDGETTYRGRAVVAIRDTTQGGTLYVAAEGTPYPVAIKGARNQGAIAFDDWNTRAPITAPKAAVDLGRLGG
jgi:hypothetical protein